ncbi:MAG: hypothetical protein ABR924_01705 [Terracidiphilus sp.]
MEKRLAMAQIAPGMERPTERQLTPGAPMPKCPRVQSLRPDL